MYCLIEPYWALREPSVVGFTKPFHRAPLLNSPLGVPLKQGLADLPRWPKSGCLRLCLTPGLSRRAVEELLKHVPTWGLYEKRRRPQMTTKTYVYMYVYVYICVYICTNLLGTVIPGSVDLSVQVYCVSVYTDKYQEEDKRIYVYVYVKLSIYMYLHSIYVLNAARDLHPSWAIIFMCLLSFYKRMLALCGESAEPKQLSEQMWTPTVSQKVPATSCLLVQCFK